MGREELLPKCRRCFMQGIEETATHLIRNLNSKIEPVCSEHYTQFCIGFGNLLIMRELNRGFKDGNGEFYRFIARRY